MNFERLNSALYQTIQVARVLQRLDLSEAANQAPAQEDERQSLSSRSFDKADAQPVVARNVYLLERVTLALEEAPGPPAGTAAGPGVDHNFFLVHSHPRLTREPRPA
jgi:hypothetical protein